MMNPSAITPTLPRDSLFSEASLKRDASAATGPDLGQAPWQRDMLENFLKNQLKLAFALPLIAVALSMTALLWSNFGTVACWFVGVIGANLIQLFLCKLYFRAERTSHEQQEWIGLIAASELMQGVFWVVPLFFFWPGTSSQQGTFLIAAIMAVAAMRFLIVNNFMPILIAGTGVMTIGVAMRCIASFDPVYISLACILMTLEALFLLIARQLQDTARERLIFRHQKDLLIDDLKLARDVANEQRNKAESANRAKSAFLANMSHELRTPLNAILGFSEILEQEMFGPMANHTYKDYAGDIHSSGQYLLALINDILDVSRIEAGRRDLQEAALNLEEVIGDALRICQNSANKKQISVAIQVTPGLPRVRGDERALRQVMINLLANAVKFTPAGGAVKAGAKHLGNGAVQIFVCDNGPGIPPDEIADVLSAFARGKMASFKAIEGTGLGLSIVNGLVQLHDGNVEIESRIGEGTTVYFTLPAKRVLSGPRGALHTTMDNVSETQRALIGLTA